MRLVKKRKFIPQNVFEKNEKKMMRKLSIKALFKSPSHPHFIFSFHEEIIFLFCNTERFTHNAFFNTVGATADAQCAPEGRCNRRTH